MSWEDGTGRHEGYVVCVFADGTMGACWSTWRVRVIRDRYNQPLASRRAGWRPRAAIVGWRVGCDCVPHDAVDPVGDELNRVERDYWLADVLWSRVFDPRNEDLRDFRIFATNRSADRITERDDIHALAYSVWAEHVATANVTAQPGRPDRVRPSSFPAPEVSACGSWPARGRSPVSPLGTWLAVLGQWPLLDNLSA